MPFHPDMIEGMVRKFGNMPIWELLRRYEMEMGNFVILPGQREWFPAADWDETSVISIDGDEVRIHSLLSRHRGIPGMLKRFEGSLKDAGLSPVFINPMKDVEEMLRASGWRFTIVGEFPVIEYRWRPADKKARMKNQ